VAETRDQQLQVLVSSGAIAEGVMGERHAGQAQEMRAIFEMRQCRRRMTLQQFAEPKVVPRVLCACSTVYNRSESSRIAKESPADPGFPR
jgi:hypothetical protein